MSKTISYGGNFIVYKIAIVEDLEMRFLKRARLVKFDFLKNEVLFIIKTRNVLTPDQTHVMFLSGKTHANFLWKSKFVASHTTIWPHTPEQYAKPWQASKIKRYITPYSRLHLICLTGSTSDLDVWLRNDY